MRLRTDLTSKRRAELRAALGMQPTVSVYEVRGPKEAAARGKTLPVWTSDDERRRRRTRGLPTPRVLRVKAEPALTGSDFASATRSKQRTIKPTIEVVTTFTGRNTLAAVSYDQVGRQLAIVVGGQIVSAPIVRSPILDGRFIVEGDFTGEQMARILRAFRAGRGYPVPVKVEAVDRDK